ncbi:response regulator [Pelagibius sp. 7325]|uniref:response regulator transcription factor n=1 Tax=Pelagibius sp. 7325 TaxID=3131994 RepID=UPI0030EE861D
MRVMIVEDEPNIVESLSFIFSREGWQVTAALDGDTAIERLLSEAPDILVLDVMLPPHSGFEVLKRVRSEPGLKHLPVIVLTAKGQEKDRHTALRLGADAFVTKPFSNRDIVQQVRDLAASKQGAGGGGA